MVTSGVFVHVVTTDKISVVSRSNSSKRKKYGSMTDVMKKIRLSSHETGPDGKCQRLNCFDNVSPKQRLLNIKELNEMKTYDEQHLYLFGLMSINQVKQHRPIQDVNHAIFHDNAYTYKVRVSNGQKIIEAPVCAKAFVSIHGITTRRVQTLQKSGKALGAAPKDKHGKYNHIHSKRPPHIEKAVKEHIASFKVNTSHYSRGASKKLYLPPELNILTLCYSQHKTTGLRVTFPIRGHSYWECDRNMALIQLNTPAELPEHWWNHFSVAGVKPSAFHVIEVDQALLRSWTNFLSAEYKKKCPFAFRPMKEVFQHALGPLVHHRSTYNGAWESPSLKEPLRRSHPQDIKDAAAQDGGFRLPDYLYDGMLAAFFTL
ncbi:hypothetical protein PR048_001316 [Dryococelus australis]|uniref:Uncharacterized protein n=1 Tax=Dryococelus australis TaxID=614101 RepID=A0ABQ9IIH8_9NEOP|nr:hypothetical protein PR048_001316 [Dryococelus australis]